MISKRNSIWKSHGNGCLNGVPRVPPFMETLRRVQRSNVGWGDYRLVPDARFCPKCGRLRSRLEAQTVKIELVIWISMHLACAGFSMACQQRRSESLTCSCYRQEVTTLHQGNLFKQTKSLRKASRNERVRLFWSCKDSLLCSSVFILEVGLYALPAWSVVVGLGRLIWERRGPCRDESVVSKERVKHWPPNNFWRCKRWRVSGRHQRWTLLVANSSTFCFVLVVLGSSPCVNLVACTGAEQRLGALACKIRLVQPVLHISHKLNSSRYKLAPLIMLIPLASGHSSSPCSPWSFSLCGVRQVPTRLHLRGQDSMMVGQSDLTSWDQKMQGQWLLQRRALYKYLKTQALDLPDFVALITESNSHIVVEYPWRFTSFFILCQVW